MTFEQPAGQPDSGGSYFRPTAAGETRAKTTPAWAGASGAFRRSLFKPATLPKAPGVHVDRSPEAYAQRVIKAIGAMDRRCADQAGRHFGDGFVCLATDGHRMILTRTTATNPAEVTRQLAVVSEAHEWIEISPAVELALRRAYAVTGHGNVEKGRAPAVMLRIGDFRQLHIDAADADDRSLCSSHEIVDVDGTIAAGIEVRLNVRYVLDALGLAPTRLYFQPGKDDQPVILDNPVYRYVCMPIRK